MKVKLLSMRNKGEVKGTAGRWGVTGDLEESRGLAQAWGGDKGITECTVRSR